MRIIDADDFVLKLQNVQKKCTATRDSLPRYRSRWQNYQTILLFINAIIGKLNDPDYTPTIDAEPVRHGRCQKSTEKNEWYDYNYTCMECGAHMMVCDASGTDIAPKCCANCGVKMDGDSHGTE